MEVDNEGQGALVAIRRQFKLYFLAALIFQLAFCFASVYAESESTISVSVSEPDGWTSRPRSASVAVFPISVTTNNPTGYSVRMETIGNSTDLESGNEIGSVIPTIVLSPGQTSVTLNEMVNSYGYSMDGSNFKPVPEVNSGGDLLADMTNVSSDTVNVHDLTFGVSVSNAVPSGKYENTFLVTVVAKDPLVCEVGYICYERNGGSIGIPVEKQAVEAGSTDVMLTAPSFGRPGYGFVGWNTKVDGSGTDYGPNELISAEQALSSGLMLYAKWTASVGDFQNWNGCEAMAVGSVIALTDNRDGNTYAVTKMSDGACWMMENLRLDLSDPNLDITASNTNNPSAAFIDGMRNNRPQSTTEFCQTVSSGCLNRIRFNTDRLNPESEDYHFASGVYYNWYTATAGNGLYSSTDSKPTAGDICPANWRLPRSIGVNSDYIDLDLALGGDGENAMTPALANRWRKYPINNVLGGQLKNNALIELGVSGNYYASEGITNERASNLWLLADKSQFVSNTASKHRGQAVRCIMKKTSTVKFDKNTPDGASIDGTMDDQYIARGISKKLAKNTFTHTYANRVLYKFKEWNTKSDGSGDSYGDEAEVRDLTAVDGEITLYAQWDVTNYGVLEVVFDENAIGSFTAQGGDYGNGSVSTSGGTIEVAIDKPYTISFDLDVEYEFVRYEVTSGSLGSTTTSPTTYTMSNDSATLTIVTKECEHPLYIQNLDSSVCSTTPKLVTDIRDGQQYLVQRLADGNCWMIDDLRLGSVPLQNAISSENTNISSGTSFTMPALSNTMTTNRNNPQASGAVVGQVINHFGNTTGQAGVYYNYCSATAGTVCNHSDIRNATEDICAAGWRLPTGDSGGEQETLFNQFGTVAGMQTGASLTYAGWYTTANNGEIKEYETASWTWSSSGKSNNKAHVMFIGRTKKSFADGAFEYYGENVRCVLK